MENIQKSELKKMLPLWLQEHGYPLKRSFRCLNPQHEDRHPSMCYFEQTQTVHCFSCGATYDIFHLVGMEEQISEFPKQLKRTQERYGTQTAQREKESSSYMVQKENTSKQEEKVIDFIQQHQHNQPKELLDWFAQRGIPKEMVKQSNIFLHEGRAIFPIGSQGQWVSWCGRALQDTVTPRYRNSAGKMGIWGIEQIFEWDNQPVAVCEGILDAMSLQLCGCKAVALCGASNVGRLMEEVQKLSGKLPPFLLAGDNDEAGQRMCNQLQQWIEEQGGQCIWLSLPDGCKDVNEAWVEKRQQLQKAVELAKQQLSFLMEPKESSYQQQSMAAMTGDFLEYVDRCKEMGLLSSGLQPLDGLLGGGIFPGLYVLGAPSSLGKTTLLLQIADEIAAAGRDVLFFSLEMSRWELLAKSLCRIAAPEMPLSARGLLQGEIPRQQLESLLEAYNQRCGSRIFISAEHSALTPAMLVEKVHQHQRQRGQAPVVVVDYLQILAPSDPRSSDKQNIDRAVVALKALSRDLEIPVLVASSFNRDSYSRTASMEAFKESGAVEYAADVLLALQMSAMEEKDFDMNREKAADPRKVDLVLLKNRNGVPYGKVPLLYYGAANRFVPVELTPQPPHHHPVRRIGRKK